MEKVEWLYKPASQSKEDYLLGKRIDKYVDPTFENYQTSASDLHAGPVDLASKVKEDPLFAIKQTQEAKRKEVANNPVKMKKLKQISERKKRKNKKHSSDRTRSPHNKHSSHRTHSPHRSLSPHQKHSSNRTRSPHRSLSPHQKHSSHRTHSPHRSLSPHQKHSSNRTRSPHRSLSPHRTRFPHRSRGAHSPHQSRETYSPHGSRGTHSPHRSRETYSLHGSRGTHSPHRSLKRHDKPSKLQSHTRFMEKGEIERKRQEMLDCAKEHGESRLATLRRRKIDDLHVQDPSPSGPSFIQSLRVQSLSSSSSVADRIHRNIQSVQRTKSALDSTFLRDN